MNNNEVTRLPFPTEALIRAISKKIGVRFGNVKIGFDTCLTIIAVVIALLSFHKLNGVREGTIFDALFVGQMIKFFVDKGEPMKNKLFGVAEEIEEELVMELETEAE